MNERRRSDPTLPVACAALTAALLLTAAQSAPAQPGRILWRQKISSTQGGFTGILDLHDYFGTSVASLGDLDFDGVVDLAVGAFADDDGGTEYGAVWVLLLNADGTVKIPSEDQRHARRLHRHPGLDPVP